MKRSTLLASLLVGVIVSIPGGLEAYPGYGKKLNPKLTESCSTCHVMYPKLKLYGRTIKETGYNVPLYEGNYGGLNQIYHAIPAAIRGKVEIANHQNDQTGIGVEVKELQLLSAGNALNNKLTWWFHKHVMEDNELVSLTEGVPHESWLQFNRSDALHVRVGMSELPLWFSPSKTKVSEIEYLYYGATSNQNNLGAVSSPQLGIQANGHFSMISDEWGDETDDNYAEGYSYAVAITNGKASFEGRPNTFFARITRKDPRYSIGVFTLGGREEAMAGEANQHSAGAPEKSDGRKDFFYRVGADADLYLVGDVVNLYGSLAYGKDFEKDFIGGFVGYERLMKSNFLLSLRFDVVEFLGDVVPEEGLHHEEEHDGAAAEGDHLHGSIISDDASSVSFTFCYLFFGNVRLGVDYRYGLNGIDTKGMLLLQFAF